VQHFSQQPQQEAADNRSDNADNNVTQETKVAAFQDGSYQPTRHGADGEKNQQLACSTA